MNRIGTRSTSHQEFATNHLGGKLGKETSLASPTDRVELGSGQGEDTAAYKNWQKLTELAGSLGYKLPPSPDAKGLGKFLEHQKTANPQGYQDLSYRIIRLTGRKDSVLRIPGQEIGGHFRLALADYAKATAPLPHSPSLKELGIELVESEGRFITRRQS